MTPDFDCVELSGLTRHFGRRRAVHNVSLTVRRGEILGLLGPNGAGKSTLIGMLATLVAPSAGTIRYGTTEAKAAGPELRRSIGLLAHELHLYGELTAAQNLEFFARLYDLDPAAVVTQALARADLSERANDAVSGFSRGMRQRLALERTLLHRPRLVLLDEPFTGLDDQAVRKVSARLKELAAEDAIVILATHDLDLADGLITRMAVVKNGKLQTAEQGTAGVRARYRELTTGEHVH